MEAILPAVVCLLFAVVGTVLADVLGKPAWVVGVLAGVGALWTVPAAYFHAGTWAVLATPAAMRWATTTAAVAIPIAAFGAWLIARSEVSVWESAAQSIQGGPWDAGAILFLGYLMFRLSRDASIFEVPFQAFLAGFLLVAAICAWSIGGRPSSEWDFNGEDDTSISRRALSLANFIRYMPAAVVGTAIGVARRERREDDPDHSARS